MRLRGHGAHGHGILGPAFREPRGSQGAQVGLAAGSPRELSCVFEPCGTAPLVGQAPARCRPRSLLGSSDRPVPPNHRSPRPSRMRGDDGWRSDAIASTIGIPKPSKSDGKTKASTSVQPRQLIVPDIPQRPHTLTAKRWARPGDGEAGASDDQSEEGEGLEQPVEVLARLDRRRGEEVRPTEIRRRSLRREPRMKSRIRDDQALARDSKPGRYVLGRELRVSEDHVAGLCGDGGTSARGEPGPRIDPLDGEGAADRGSSSSAARRAGAGTSSPRDGRRPARR